MLKKARKERKMKKRKYDNAPQYCSQCGKKLSGWNSDRICFRHSAIRRYQGIIGGLREQSYADVRTSPHIYE